jgi:ADP-ribose pyrophosphatase
MDHPAWKVLRSQVLLDRSPWLRVIAEDVELPDGRRVEGYLRLEAPDFAVAVPVDQHNQMGLIRSYRHGLGAVDLQPPAGYIERGEDPLETAQRELLEEMGCQADHWRPLGRFVLGGNRGAGWAHCFLATGCRRMQPPASGDLERQELLWLPVQQVAELWRAGAFQQLASVASIGLALAALREGSP